MVNPTSDTRNPFDILPANLFNLFSTQGYGNLSRHYMAILLRVYALAEFNRFGLTREMVIAEIVDYLASDGVAEAVAAAVDEEEDLAELAGRSGWQDYAGYLLRRLADSGWIEREQQADYSEYIILPDYAFTLLEAIRSVQEQKPREYHGQLYTAHQLISHEGENFSPALALTQAYQNVRQVVRGLNELNHNIRRYIERAAREREVADLLRLQYDDYATVLGPAYHAFKTSDHISRYRRDIVGKLQAWQSDEQWLERAADELALQARISPGQAANEIGHSIRFIIQQLESLDPLLDEIDRRHAQYLRTSLRQIRCQLVSAEGGFKDRLSTLARRLAELQAEGQASLPDDAPGLQLATVRLPDANSFYTMPQRRAPFEPEAIHSPALNPLDLATLRAVTLQEINQSLTPEKIKRFVGTFFNGHRRIHVQDLPPEALSDVPRLIYTIAYSHHPDVDYGLELAPGEPVEIGPYKVEPFELVKM
ncbi:MAG: hypothetical protein JW850_14855 [Thermoflexales bacterium]|nr:hypothetical protein [Thermoflexales bacterium]